MAWVESVSPSFRARHESGDVDDVAAVLEELERTRDGLGRLLGATPGDVTVVFHGTAAQLDLAKPALPLLRRLDAPAARRYRVGAASTGRIDVLSPRALRDRASGSAGSLEMLLRVPPTLYARLALARANPAFSPPATPRRLRTALACAWVAEGFPAWYGGQTAHARPAIVRRLREGRTPAFPPARPDAALLGGTVFELLAAESGPEAAVALALALRAPQNAKAMLEEAFSGRSPRHTEAAWRAHLARS